VETTLEVEITSDSKALTLLQIPCTLKNAVIDVGAVQPLVLDTYLSQVTADGRYLRQSNNLSDLGSTSTARTNLGVYSTSQVDTALALKADDSDLLLKADLAGAAFTGNVTLTGRMGIGGGLANNTAHKLAIYDGNIVFSSGFGLAFGDGTVQTTAFTGSAATSWGTITGNLSSQTDLAQALSGKANLTGATFTGKVSLTDLGTNNPSFNIGGTALSTTATNAISGDVWISGTSPKISYKVGTSNFYCATSNLTNTFSSAQIIDTTATTPALRVTQKGAGSALVVEDSTTPDSDALIVDANGNLGIGVSNNPGSVWSGSTYKLEVQGSALVTGTLRVPYQIDVGTSGDASMIVQSSINFPNYGGTLGGFTTQSNPNTSGSFSYGDYPSEIIINLNGNLYAVPARQLV
jgi:hypothetical protein